MSELTKLQKDLRNVLLYTQELVGFREKVVYDVSAQPHPNFHESAIVGLEGVDLAPDEENWLRIRRLRETRPPAPDAVFNGWTKQPILMPSPEKAPTLLESRMLRLPIEELSDLIEAALIDPDDVMRPRDADDEFPNELDAILRPARMSEFLAEWRAYVTGPWEKWAVVERPRRKSIKFYNELYAIQQRVTAAGEDNNIELVWGIGLARWKHPDETINVPVIEQLVELDLLEDGTILLAPRQVSPSLGLKAFHALEVPGSKNFQREAAEKLERILDDPDMTFSSFERRSYEGLLKSCAAQLSPTGVYVPDEEGREATDRSLPPFDEVLRVTDTWILFVRPRAEDFRKDDIQKLIKKVEQAESEADLPQAGLQFVKEPSNEMPVTDELFDLGSSSWRLPDGPAPGWNPGSGGSSGDPVDRPKKEQSAFFFPLPYNQDQLDILARLEEADGVLVQGPPGTGKTHTIANVICHYLATGRRILVTAKTPEALTALHDKLPPGIRDLAISIIHNDREGARQLEQAVEVLANSAKQIKEHEVAEQIIDRQNRLADTLERIAAIDNELLAYARRNLEEVENGGVRRLPMELAKRVVEDAVRHLWFQDRLDVAPQFEPQFGDTEIQEAREARLRLGGDIIYRPVDLPDPGAFVDVARILAAHDELARDKAIDEKSRSGSLPYMAIVAIERARAAHLWLKGFHGFFEEIRADVWLITTYQTLCGFRQSDEAATSALKRALEQWSRLYKTGYELTLRGIDVGDLPVDHEAFDATVGKLARGEKPFGLFSFNGVLKTVINRVTVGGSAPASAEEWGQVRDLRGWQREAQTFLRQWSTLAVTLGLPPVPTDWAAGRGELMRVGRLIASLLEFSSAAADRVADLQSLFPHGLDAKSTIYEGQVALALEALAANLEKVELAAAHAVRGELESLVGGRALPFHAALADFCGALGDRAVPASDIADAWRQIHAEASRLAALCPARVRLDEIGAKIRASGGPAWADKLSTDPALATPDPWTPSDWRESWEWSRADGFIKKLADRGTIARLSAERTDLEAKQRSLLGEVVRLRTFLGLKRRMTNRIQAALAKFASAVARLGAGTGKSAGRHRRVIRDATMDAAAAVPCWILPEWRVSEQLPAELAAFDLVIIDEASQSDITALPAILRGKKLLIVGDDKQVSPSHVGLDERTVIQLRTTFLSGLPFSDQMDPATSLYELGGMLFPGKAILLREHFRCVEPIIRFSSRFYQNLLVPMRLPTATERLDPPLVDIFVRDGEKTGDVNLREVDVIVDEVRRISEDPTFAGRSIGIISLIGDKQAKLIYDRLMRELGAEIMERHRIRCGNASTFQGQERNIVLVSMVACPKTAFRQRSRMYEQRFNVAMSRARDRLILVRSVSSSDLKPGDLKLQIIEHFRNPMEGGQVAQGKDVLEACDSGFEKDFGARLLEMGYRLRAQVPVGGRFIDFVIEGANDSRLAIELDGDKYHGPERWAADFDRQIAMERLGWTFWRCWGSSWAADREGCLDDLKRVLAKLGIEPIGADTVEGTWTEFREAVREIGPTADEPMAPEDPMEMLSEAIRSALDEPKPLPVPEVERSVVAEPGDFVVVRFDDERTRPLRIMLSRTENRPEMGIVHVSEPLGQALLGRGVEEEIEVDIGGGVRIAIIEEIDRRSAMAA